MNLALDTILAQVEKPSRYTGGELNATQKPFESADITFAFCFPDTYEVAMSHLGMKILYGIINNMPGALCERVCMPWLDMRDALKEHQMPLFSLESKTALSRFDIVGFTLQYEMSYTNILDMLDLGHVPVLCADRAEDDPIVVAGGPCAYNPEPLHLFIDAFMIGDGEEVMIELVNLLKECKQNHTPRAEKLRLLSKLEGVYVPSLYVDRYHLDGTLQSLTPIDEDVPLTVKKRLVMDMDKAYVPSCTPVPYMQVIHDRIMIEIMRGCTRGCRFCQAGMLYRPVRERSVEKLVSLAKEAVKHSGFEEISLSSLSSSDYGCISELSERLTQELMEKRVSLSLPSLRVDKFVGDTLSNTKKIKKSSLTFAPEAGTQRLRDVINKGVTEENLKETLSFAFGNGWNAVKLYFMIGLPTETSEDLIGIAELAKTAAGCYFSTPKGTRVKGLRISCSAAVFVPKPFTPFQWCAQDLPEVAREKQGLLRTEFRQLRSANLNYHDSDVSQMEACFATGDRRLAKVLHRAWELGCIMDGWHQSFRYDLWLQAFQDCDLEVAFYAHRNRDLNEVLPWDHIDAGISKAFLKHEYKKAMNAEITEDCRNGCNHCGLHKREGGCPGCE